ncbi:MAG TPA: sulfotransferase domain-containing protein [Trueperaceae bacterium]
MSRLERALRARRYRLESSFRLLTSSLRMLPRTLLIGAQKAGTTSLFEYIVQHPAVGRPRRKEVRFFHKHYGRGMKWYHSQFPIPIPGVTETIDASPGYLDHPHVPARTAHHLPDARFIVLLRDPVERAWSHYRHSLRLGAETLSFTEALSAEDERIEPLLERMEKEPTYYPEQWAQFTYRRKGRYAEHLERWFSHFDRRRFLILTSHEFRTSPEATMERVWRHLELPPHRASEYPRYNEGQAVQVSDPATGAAMTKLRNYFEPHDQRLEELLGRSLEWREARGSPG